MKRRIALLAGVLVLVSAGVWFYAWANGPASSTASTTQGPENVFGSQIKLQPYSGKLFTTQIPSTLILKSSTESAGPTLGQYLFKGTDSSVTDQLGITIGVMQSSSLDEVAAVKLRLGDTETYTRTEINEAPEGAIAFTKNTDYETTVFWPYQGKYVGIAVSGSVLRQAELSEIMSSVLTNWQWL